MGPRAAGQVFLDVSGGVFHRGFNSVRFTTGLLVIAVLVVLGDAREVLAWGPGVHIGLGSSVLNGLSVLPAAVAALLARHGVSYLYGNIAADVVFAKRLSRVKQFCHHWSTGFALLDEADDDRSKAFAYGYLAHLAADTVAHGKFVPRQLVVSRCTLNFGHVYWEMRADATEPGATRKKLEAILQADHADHHARLERRITDTFLPYDLNRALFARVNSLVARRAFHRAVDTWSHCSRWYLSPSLVEAYRSECVDRIQSILSEGTRSPLVREDPNGTSALMQVRVRRRELRRLKRRSVPVEGRRIEASHGLAPCPAKTSPSFSSYL